MKFFKQQNEKSSAILHPLEVIIKDSLPLSQLGQNRHNMWQHEIHCDTTSYRSQQRLGGNRC